MAILTDFFVATPAVAVRYAASMAGESGEELTLDGLVGGHGIGGLALGVLWAQVTGVAPDARTHSLTEVACSEDGEIRLDEFPAPFVAQLAELDADALPGIAAAWQRKLNLVVPVDVLAALLAELRRLAVDARERGERLYLFTSL